MPNIKDFLSGAGDAGSAFMQGMQMAKKERQSDEDRALQRKLDEINLKRQEAALKANLADIKAQEEEVKAKAEFKGKLPQTNAQIDTLQPRPPMPQNMLAALIPTLGMMQGAQKQGQEQYGQQAEQGRMDEFFNNPMNILLAGQAGIVKDPIGTIRGMQQTKAEEARLAQKQEFEQALKFMELDEKQRDNWRMEADKGITSPDMPEEFQSLAQIRKQQEEAKARGDIATSTKKEQEAKEFLADEAYRKQLQQLKINETKAKIQHQNAMAAASSRSNRGGGNGRGKPPTTDQIKTAYNTLSKYASYFKGIKGRRDWDNMTQAQRSSERLKAEEATGILNRAGKALPYHLTSNNKKPGKKTDEEIVREFLK